MSKQNQPVAAQAAHKPQQKPIPAPVTEMSNGVAVAEVEAGGQGLVGGLSLQGQAGRLGDPRLRTIQRQTIAGQIGRTQGNSHLHQVVVFSKQNQLSAPYQSNSRVQVSGQPAFVQRKTTEKAATGTDEQVTAAPSGQQTIDELLPDELADSFTMAGDDHVSNGQIATENAQRATKNVDTAERDTKVQKLKSDVEVAQVPQQQQQTQVEQVAEQVTANVENPPPDEAAPSVSAASIGEVAPVANTVAIAENGGTDTMAVAESVAEMATQANDPLDTDVLGDLPQVEPPEPITPVDSGGMPLPNDPEGDLLAANVANRINSLRQHGRHLRSGAQFSKLSAKKAKATIAQAKQRIAQADSGIGQMAQQTAARKDIMGKAESALQISKQKAEMVASKAPALVAKADEGKQKTGPMSAEARDLAAKSNGNIPDDPKAGSKMKQQGQKLNKVSSDIGSLDDAINQSKNKASTLGEEAAQAKQKNDQTKGKIVGAKATLEQTETKIDELRTQNTQSKGQIDSFVGQPDEMLAQAATLDAEGQVLIDASVEMEAMLQETQEKYQSGMQSVPAIERGNRNSPGMVQRSAMTSVVQRGGYDDRGSVIDVGSMDPLLTGDYSSDEERRDARERETQRRRDQLARINQMGDGHFKRASIGEKLLMSLNLWGENLFGGISNITVTDIDKFMGKIALAFVNPYMAMGGIVAGLNMMLTGGANLFSREQWSKDPYANLLKSASDIATGLTVILGSLSALAGVIILLMGALELVTLGAATPIVAAVVPICTTILATTLPWTFTVGKVALILQAFTLLGNLYDAGAASTADELQQNAEQLSDDVKNMGSVVLLMGGAKLGQRALPKQQAWAESLANMPPGGGIKIVQPEFTLAGGGPPGMGSVAISGGALVGVAEGVVIPIGAAVGTAAVTAPMAMVGHGNGGGRVTEGGAESEPRRVYEPSQKHGSQSYGTRKGESSPAPKNGEKALEKSVQVKSTTSRRVGVDKTNNEIVVFDETHPGKSIYHGHVRNWNKLTDDMKNALLRAGLVNRKGKIISGD